MDSPAPSRAEPLMLAAPKPMRPAFSSPSSPRASSPRPDFSTVHLPSTSAISPPPRSRSTTPRPEFSEQYGAFDSHSYEDEEKERLRDSSASRAAGVPSRTPGRKGRTWVGLIFKMILATAAIVAAIALLFYLSYIPPPPAKLARHLSPFLPISFAALLAPTQDRPASPHPILPLLTSANEKWTALITSQSTTFDRATKTYKARYSLTPPPGFDKWFAFAIQGRNHSLVDEYDSLMEDLLPYRSLSPEELRRRTAELAQVPGISIVSIRDGVAQVHSKGGKWAPARAFQLMLGAFVRDLPDMDVAINEKPEGRVLPRRQRTVLMEDYGVEDQEIVQNIYDPILNPSLTGFKPDWQRDGSVWEAFRRACPTESPSRRLVESVRSAESGVGSPALLVQGRAGSKSQLPLSRRKPTGQAYPPTRELTFNPGLETTYDICAHPSMHSLHSTFFSDQRSIEYLYPVFSPSKPTGYADILIPSHHYWSPSSEFTYEWEMKRGRTKDATDLAWAQKKPTIYWRGKVTRGADTPPGHAGSFQKQRLVKMANEATMLAHRVLVAFAPGTASLSSMSAPVAIVNKAVSDIAMACDPSMGECAYLRSLGYRVTPPGPLSDAWKHKYVLDLDEIGFSPRFLALMESNSVVVKSSVQKEFWNGWVVPWKHYIPLSSSYAELYNIQTFFSGFPAALTANASLTSNLLTTPYPVPELPTTSDGQPFEGDRALQDIAEAGKNWRQSYVRKADMECYVYRLMIEWAAMTRSPVTP